MKRKRKSKPTQRKQTRPPSTQARVLEHSLNEPVPKIRMKVIESSDDYQRQVIPGAIVWTRLDNKCEPPFEYLLSGELDAHVQWVKIITRRSEDLPFDDSITFIKRKQAAIALIQNAINDGQARAYQYKIVETIPTQRHPMTLETKERLRAAKLETRKRRLAQMEEEE
jgi:hypothetical protein